MSGQFPGGYQSPSGHRGNYNSPMIQQQLNQMNVPNQMGMMGFNQNNVMNTQQMQGGPGQGGPEMGLNQNMMQQANQQQQQQQQQGPQGIQSNAQQIPTNQHQQGQPNQMVGQNQQHQGPQPSPQMVMQQSGGNVGPGNVMGNQQQQVTQQNQPPPNQPSGGTAVQQQQKAEFNLLSLCRIGQETVQDIVSRFQEVFGILRAIQPPNGTNQGQLSSNDKKAKVQEQFRTIRLLFKRLRLLYDKCNDNCQQGMEYTHVESLIPLKGELERSEPVHTEEYKKTLQENRELVAMVQLKNKQLREIIDKIRLTIWEINTMLSMRRC